MIFIITFLMIRKNRAETTAQGSDRGHHFRHSMGAKFASSNLKQLQAASQVVVKFFRPSVSLFLSHFFPSFCFWAALREMGIVFHLRHESFFSGDDCFWGPSLFLSAEPLPRLGHILFFG